MEAATAILYDKFGATKVNIIYALLCLATSAISVILLLGLIFYETNVNERNRTLINKIYSLLLAYVIVIIICLNTADIARALFGPLAITICSVYCGCIQALTVTICLALNETIIVKYLYCCIFKSIGGLDDYFWSHFLSTLNIMLTSYIALFLLYCNMVPLGLFVYCSGCDPKKVVNEKLIYATDTPFPIYFVWLTLFIHIILQYQIGKVEATLNSITKSHPMDHSKRDILASYMNIFILIFMGVIVVFIVAHMNEVESSDALQLWRPVTNLILGCGISVYTYVKHPHIRNYILKRRMHVVKV